MKQIKEEEEENPITDSMEDLLALVKIDVAGSNVLIQENPKLMFDGVSRSSASCSIDTFGSFDVNTPQKKAEPKLFKQNIRSGSV